MMINTMQTTSQGAGTFQMCGLKRARPIANDAPLPLQKEYVLSSLRSPSSAASVASGGGKKRRHERGSESHRAGETGPSQRSSVCGTGNGRCTVWNTLMENGQRLYKQQQTQHDEKEVAHGISHAEQGGYHNSISDETSGRSGRSQWTQQVLPFGRNNGKSEDDASSGERRITHTCSNCAQQVANHTAQCSFCLKHTCLGCATSCASCSNLLCTPCKCLEHFPGGIAEVCPPCVEMLHHRPNQFSQEHEDTCMG
eukprot:gb/GECG01012808.1/.p1 GENE.gb/GECG01012808.1/~~gb/GECG01012808.1/.p1  ORF type:complete len:254 (+),score=25.61 gb/GECG01012808.1/:1-762(+)